MTPTSSSNSRATTRVLAVAPSDGVAATRNDDPLMDRDELAAYLNVSSRTARTLIEERRLDVVVMGRTVRVRQSTAERYIAACTQAAARPAGTDSFGRDVWLPRAA